MNEDINKIGINEKIYNFLKEINNKKDFLNSFKKRNIKYNKNSKNNNKSESILINFNTLNNLINEFEKSISLSLEIILLLQNVNKKNINKIPINLKENKNSHYNEYYNNTNNTNNKRLLFKTFSIKTNKNNINRVFNNFNKINKTEKNICDNNYCSNNDKIQNDKLPYHLYLKNQLNTFSKNKNNKNNNNLFHFKDNSYRHNFPSLKERTLQTLYNSENINYNKRNNNDLENNKSDDDELLSEDNIYDKDFNNNNLGNNTNKIKTKTPIRKALRALIKEKNMYNKSCNQFRNTNYNTIDTNENENDDDLINRINESKIFKLYFAQKYGDGKYNNFLDKYKNNLINKKEIENEMIIISNIYELKEKNEQNLKTYYSSISNNNSNDLLNKPKTSIGVPKRLLLKKNNIKNSIINDKKQIKNNNKKNLKNYITIPKSNRNNKYTNIEELIKSFNEQ